MIFRNMSAKDCFRRVIDADLYATKFIIISIQDEMCRGFKFNESEYCIDVLTLEFDDADEYFDGVTLYTEEQARQVISFVAEKLEVVDEILIHCTAGVSRSAGIAAALSKIYNGDDERYFKAFSPNRLVYRKTMNAWESMKNDLKT